VIVFIFDWFKPSHCDKCDRAEKRGDAIFALLRDLTWSPEEQEQLRKAAGMMADEED
jgi:hypothetical protein